VGLIPEASWPRIGARLGLSAREMDVARLMVEGMTRRQLAGRLRCSPSTVRYHIDQLFAKLEAEDRVALVLRLVREWLTLDLGDCWHKSAGQSPGSDG
jgi:DNA-binding CsgD family transcriptional regulator